MARPNRRLEAETLNQPVLVVENAKFFQCPNQFRYRLEVPDPQQLLLERPEEAFDTAVAFRLANKRRRRLDSQEGEFVLEVVAHELRTVIVPESESFGAADPEAAEVLTDTLAEGFESLEAGGTLDGMNAHTLGRAMINGSEDGDLAVVEGDRCRGVDAPHPVGTIGGDGSAMDLGCDGHGLALGRQQLEETRGRC